MYFECVINLGLGELGGCSARLLSSNVLAALEVRYKFFIELGGRFEFLTELGSGLDLINMSGLKAEIPMPIMLPTSRQIQGGNTVASVLHSYTGNPGSSSGVTFRRNVQG